LSWQFPAPHRKPSPRSPSTLVSNPPDPRHAPA
jgi:hypothetical protein